MRVAVQIELSDAERAAQVKWSRGRSTPSRLVLRAKIVLAAETQVHSQGAGGWSEAEGPVERREDRIPCPSVFGSSGLKGDEVTARCPSRGHPLRC